MRDWRIEPIAERLQASGLDASSWPETLGYICRATDSFGAVLFSTNTQFIRPTASADLVPATGSYVRDGWNTQDERYGGIPKIQRTGIAIDEDFMSPDAMHRSPYYQEFLRKHGIGPFAGIGFKAGEEMWVISIQRRAGQAAFSPFEQQQLLTLWRPMSDAAAMSRQLGFARVLGVADAFELMRQGCVAFNDQGGVLAMNGLASALVGTYFDVRRGQFVCLDGRSQETFDILMRSARCERRAGRSALSTGVIRDRNGTAAAVRIVPLVGWARFSFTNAAAIMLISTGKPQHDAAAPALVASFGLTKAEARFAIALLSGQSLRGIADNFGVTYETARAHLRSLFSKTGTHRQGELVARLAQHLDRALDERRGFGGTFEPTAL